MSGFALVTASAVITAIPCEYHIECAGWDGKATTKHTVLLTAWDGAGVATSELFPGSDAGVARLQIEVTLKGAGWRFREVGDTVLVIEGSKKGAVRSVTVTGDGWKPAVRWVPLLPEKK